MSEEEQYDTIFKIVMVGDSGVGKTNLISRYLKNEFNTSSKATVGIEFGNKKLQIDNKNIKTQIWDTAGQERFRSITSAYYRGAHGAIIVYDITNTESFNDVERWLHDLRNNGDEKICIMLIGNKLDLKDKRTVTEEQGKNKAKDAGLLFIETSAQSSENVNNAFEEIIKKIYDINKSNIGDDDEFIEDSTPNINAKAGIDLREKKEPIKKKKCC